MTSPSLICTKSSANSENSIEQGMTTQWQSLFYDDRFTLCHQKNADFVKLAGAMCVQAQRCEKPEDVEAKLKWLIESDGPALLDVIIDRKQPVLPMVKVGCGLHEMEVYDKGKSRNQYRALTAGLVG